jgi:diadenosine tetraphosphate (Ap4A) HIT family hydrolase
MNPDCQICEILEDPQVGQTVFSTRWWRVALNPDQAYLGHAFVTLTEHQAALSQLSAEQWQELQTVIQKYEAACRRAFGATLFNWVCLMNDAYQQPVPAPHVHWKVRPRYARPPQVGAYRYSDPNFGHHYDKSANRVVDDFAMEEIRGMLFKALAETRE